MSDLRQMGVRLWAATIGLILLVLVWQWFSLGSSKDTRRVQPEALPLVASYDIGSALQNILEHNLWEPDRKAAEANADTEAIQNEVVAAPQVSLQFKALVQKGDSLLAVIGSDNDPASFKNYAQGDTLPNGEVLLYIDADKITIGDLPDESVDQHGSTEQPQENDQSEPATTTLYLFGRTGSASE
jgi:hypothetical protein